MARTRAHIEPVEQVAATLAEMSQRIAALERISHQHRGGWVSLGSASLGSGATGFTVGPFETGKYQRIRIRVYGSVTSSTPLVLTVNNDIATTDLYRRAGHIVERADTGAIVEASADVLSTTGWVLGRFGTIQGATAEIELDRTHISTLVAMTARVNRINTTSGNEQARSWGRLQSARSVSQVDVFIITGTFGILHWWAEGYVER